MTELILTIVCNVIICAISVILSFLIKRPIRIPTVQYNASNDVKNTSEQETNQQQILPSKILGTIKEQEKNNTEQIHNGIVCLTKQRQTTHKRFILLSLTCHSGISANAVTITIPCFRTNLLNLPTTTISSSRLAFKAILELQEDGNLQGFQSIMIPAFQNPNASPQGLTWCVTLQRADDVPEKLRAFISQAGSQTGSTEISHITRFGYFPIATDDTYNT